MSLLASKPDIVQNVPLKQIATYLGITDTSLSRIRKEFDRKKMKAAFANEVYEYDLEEINTSKNEIGEMSKPIN